jgi:outer membrane protein assembly factor BamB
MRQKEKIRAQKISISIAIFLMSYVLVNPKIYGQLQELDWPIEIVSEGHGFTEGPVVDEEGKIFFTDMDNGYILHFDPSTSTTDIWHNKSGIL